ncbi:hypothetical protein EVG20_g7860 [Dentipellis fragilis]|uniref:RING-type domain-containing protein n=1 Tax=Dentipellis fragilis TaxID=205917 RepID=A0A4Y9YBI0_9AGAM|nr:hypothetical protein EVG20_g7860 [Dentipellis fragilis]
MLTLEPCSLCDVCADEYGPRNPPHCIPCGHVLCLSCCNTIIEKTPSRLQPVCPFCREQFTRSTIRLIRIDFNGSTGSGWSTPRRSPRSPRAPLIEDDFPNDLLLKANLPNLPPLPDDAEVKSRTEVRRLESRIARIAAKKCSVEEVTALHKELRGWLDSNSYSDAVRLPSSSLSDRVTHTHMTRAQFSSIHLSSLLLHAILANHVAFTESSKNAKNTEATLKSKVDELELEKSKLEAEIHRYATMSFVPFSLPDHPLPDINRPTPKRLKSARICELSSLGSRSNPSPAPPPAPRPPQPPRRPRTQVSRARPPRRGTRARLAAQHTRLLPDVLCVSPARARAHGDADALQPLARALAVRGAALAHIDARRLHPLCDTRLPCVPVPARAHPQGPHALHVRPRVRVPARRAPPLDPHTRARDQVEQVLRSPASPPRPAGPRQSSTVRA